MAQREHLLRMAALCEEMAALLRAWAAEDAVGVETGPAHAEEGGEAARAEAGECKDGEGARPPVLALLEAKKVTVKSVRALSEEEQGLRMLARMIGERFHHVRPLIDKIKKAQSSRKSVILDLASASPEAIASITQVATMANMAGLLPNYRYRRSPIRRLSAGAPVSPLAINFFTGQWLELYALHVVEEVADRLGMDVQPVCGAHVKLPDGAQFELDVAFSVGEQIFWIEAKTTDDFSELLPKYKKFSRLLCADKRFAILVWANYQDDDPVAATRGALAQMTICSLAGFREHLERALDACRSAQAAAS